MEAPKTFNARFEKETQFEIADLIAESYGRDKTEAVARAIHEAWERVQKGEFVPLGSYRQIPAANTSVASVSTVAETSTLLTRGFPIQCRHCGNRAQGPTKIASICFDCKSGGHSNNPAECPVCTAGQAI